MDIELLRQKAEIKKQVRSFFENQYYLELDTPLLCDDLIPESCLEVFVTERLYPQGSMQKSKKMYLIPSPEISMKKIISQHRVNVFQMCKCFRNGESTGHLHSSEFTMLEYYTMEADYMDSLLITEKLFAHLNLPIPFERITVEEAFKKWAGFDLFSACEKKGEMEKHARRLGLDPPENSSIPLLYDLIFIHAVEPYLKAEKPVALLNYPAFVPCLAKRKGHVTERWELYFKGIELANCFSEETDPENVKLFFKNEVAEKEKKNLVKHKVDHDYWKIFTQFPKCSGVALGLDRLIMIITGRSNIEDVIN